MTRLAAQGWAFLGLLAALGCATATENEHEEVVAVAPDAAPPESPPVDESAAAPAAAPATEFRLDAHRVLGDVVCVGALSVWPVLTDAPEDAVPMTSLADAQRRHEADVRERGPDAPGLSLAQRIRERRALRDRGRPVVSAIGPSVNELVIDNGGRAPLFVPAGTLFRGGDQDRVLAEDLVVPPDAAVLARVCCVEAGRWTATRKGTATEGHFMAVGCVAVSEVRAAGQYERSQEGVWNLVAAVNSSPARTRAAIASAERNARRETSDTGTLLASVEDVPGQVRRERDDAASAVLRHFEALASRGARAVGFAYAVHGRPVAVRTFANAALFQSQFAAFVRGMAMDAESAPRDAQQASSPARADDVVAFVRAIEASETRTVEDRGSCRLVYVSSPAGWSSSCALTVDGRDVTLAQDWTSR